MFPMISNVEELRKANGVLEEAKSGLVADGLEYASEVPVGIMIETPSAALLAPELAAECDFFSIGTHELPSYITLCTRPFSA